MKVAFSTHSAKVDLNEICVMQLLNQKQKEGIIKLYNVDIIDD